MNPILQAISKALTEAGITNTTIPAEIFNRPLITILAPPGPQPPYLHPITIWIASETGMITLYNWTQPDVPKHSYQLADPDSISDLVKRITQIRQQT